MRLPRWVAWLLRRLAPGDRAEDLVGDLEEVSEERVAQRGRSLAAFLTAFEALEMAAASALFRLRHRASPVSWIDLKLGARMLRRHPGLTLVGGLAMAFAVFAGAACYEFYSQVLHPRLPFDEGERVVMIDLIDERSQEREGRILRDFAAWRTGLSSVVDLGAAHTLLQNLATGDGPPDPVRAAALTPSAFRMTRVPPLLGRTLVDADASARAERVVVLGHDLWQGRLGGDPDVVGREVSLGGVRHTVVGVMPAGFGFPAAERLWIPLGDDTPTEPLAGPGLLVFGRLAPGRTLDEGKQEVSRYLTRATAEDPAAYEHLHARILPYAEALTGIDTLSDRLGMWSLNVFAGLFLVLVCGNVALLMFARAAAREGEIVVRTALGASRRRIVAQLFGEALVLGSLAGVLGVSAAAWALARFDNPAEFWYRTSLSPRTVMYAALLTLVGSAVAGILPGFKITRGKVDSGLRRLGAGGGGLRLGGVWTGVIVLQLAATVTFPAVGWFVGREAVDIRDYPLGVDADEYVTASLWLPPAAARDASRSDEELTPGARFGDSYRALAERLEEQTWVRSVTLTRSLPGTSHPFRRVELEASDDAPVEGGRDPAGEWLPGAVVAPNFFEALGVEAIRGRTFHAGDADPEAHTVVVNENFVRHVLGGRNAVGRRLRYLASADEWDGVRGGGEPGPWYRIVGVVPDMGTGTGVGPDERRAALYHATRPESGLARTLMVRVAGDPAALSGRLRDIAADVDPGLTLRRVGPLATVRDGTLGMYRTWVWAIVVVSALAVLLSLAGIYSTMSFAVERRTREIGVRVALGAGPTRVARAVFWRPLAQVSGGLLLGLAITAFLGRGSGVAPGVRLEGSGILLAYGVCMAAVCLTACVAPVRRALSIEPSEALAADG